MPRKTRTMKADLPGNEVARLKKLRDYDILDSEASLEFDDLTLLASQICQAPIALISLVDENRQWFKSKIGITESETPRDIAFCAHGILQNEVFIVEDTLQDSRFVTNPLVTGPNQVRFYAGSPLIAEDGHALGMICVNDKVPRQLSSQQKEALQALSRQVVALIELRQNLTKLAQTNLDLEKAEDVLRKKNALIRIAGRITRTGGWALEMSDQKVFWSDEVFEILEYPPRAGHRPWPRRSRFIQSRRARKSPPP